MSSLNWVIKETELGLQPIEQFDTTQNHALGRIVRGSHSTFGSGEFMYVQFPASTAFALGILLQWDKNFLVATVPAKSTSQKTGAPVGVPVAAVASNAATQYGWLQTRGQVPILKTAVTVSPQTAVYISATAGRFYVTSSAGGCILGARTGNTATVTSTTSTVVVYLNTSSLEGA